jgi:hypothetical protein
VSFPALMVNPRQAARVFALLLSLLFTAVGYTAHAQSESFTLTVLTPLSPPAVDPGGNSVATLSLQGTSGPVSFSTVPCTVTPVQTTGTPTCIVSPDPATPAADVFVTVSTTSSTPSGSYSVTVTGTSGSLSEPITLALGVQDVSEDYTLSLSSTTATPSTIAAGAQATAIVTITPIASYSGNVTLACLSISPVVTPSPTCSFNPATVAVGSSSIQPTSTLTITTSGPTPTTKLRSPRIFYALWLAIPGLVLAGVGTIGALKRRVLEIILLTAVASGLLFLPSCSSSNSKADNNGVTPNNTYVFTLTGTDANGAAPSSTTAATVSVTVN